MPPPPTPSSLLGLPDAWLLSLVMCKSLNEEEEEEEEEEEQQQQPDRPLVSLFRTCTSLRNLVLRQRKAVGKFKVPIASEDLAGEVDRLCTLARRSGTVKLVFKGPRAEGDEGLHEDDVPPQVWTQTEPHITHLLVCAMAELGGQPLACVKEVKMEVLEQTALVPPWLKVCCPNVALLDACDCTLTRHLPQPPPAPGAAAPPSQPAALPCQHLRQVEWRPWWSGAAAPAQQNTHIRQQLAALPSLSVLISTDREFMLEPALVSTSLTSLIYPIIGDDEEDSTPVLRGLSVQFPALREFATDHFVANDGGLEALLSLPHLRRVRISRFDLQRTYVHRPCQWEHLHVDRMDVDSFARLPLERIARCTWEDVLPSRDAQAVARVVAAVRRWGQPEAWPASPAEGYVSMYHSKPWERRSRISARDPAALFSTLGPLLAAVPPQRRRTLCVTYLENVTPDVLRALGQQLHPGVATLQLGDHFEPTLRQDTYPALLPSLPATVEEVQLGWNAVRDRDDALVALCKAAVRPVRVAIHSATQRAQLSVRLAAQGVSLVTLAAGPRSLANWS